MLSFVAFVVGVLVVGALLFLGASLLLGRGETLEPAEPDRSPVVLPGDRAVTADDVRALQLSVVARGYRMTEVDWLIDQFALVLEERDAEIADLRAQLPAHPSPRPVPKGVQEPEPDDGAPAPADPAPAGPATDDEESPRA